MIKKQEIAEQRKKLREETKKKMPSKKTTQSPISIELIEEDEESTYDRLSPPQPSLRMHYTSQSFMEELGGDDSIQISNLCDDELFKYEQTSNSINDLTSSASKVEHSD